MDIIKRGTPRDKSHTTTCRECKTKFRFKESEARFDGTDPREAPSLVVKCPVCKTEIWIAG